MAVIGAAGWQRNPYSALMRTLPTITATARRARLAPASGGEHNGRLEAPCIHPVSPAGHPHETRHLQRRAGWPPARRRSRRPPHPRHRGGLAREGRAAAFVASGRCLPPGAGRCRASGRSRRRQRRRPVRFRMRCSRSAPSACCRRFRTRTGSSVSTPTFAPAGQAGRPRFVRGAGDAARRLPEAQREPRGPRREGGAPAGRRAPGLRAPPRVRDRPATRSAWRAATPWSTWPA